MKCDRCGVGRRLEAGEPCANCAYPWPDNRVHPASVSSVPSIMKRTFRVWLEKRAQTDVLADLMLKSWNENPHVHLESVMYFTLMNYAAKADSLDRLTAGLSQPSDIPRP